MLYLYRPEIIWKKSLLKMEGVTDENRDLVFISIFTIHAFK